MARQPTPHDEVTGLFYANKKRETVLVFGGVDLPYEVIKIPGANRIKSYPIPDDVNISVRVGRQANMWEFRGTYNTRLMGGVSPFRELNQAVDDDDNFLMIMNQGYPASTTKTEGPTPPPFDFIPVIDGSSNQPIQQKVLMQSQVDERGREYIKNIPQLVDWSFRVIELHELPSTEDNTDNNTPLPGNRDIDVMFNLTTNTIDITWTLSDWIISGNAIRLFELTWSGGSTSTIRLGASTSSYSITNIVNNSVYLVNLTCLYNDGSQASSTSKSVST